MEQLSGIRQVIRLRDEFFLWWKELDFARKLLLSAAFALLTGIFAQIRIILPWTPVPLTGQTFAVFLSAVMLGGVWGGISQGLYLIGGAAGIPWFSGFSGGFASLLGPTGGYLVGFVFAAIFVGKMTERFPAMRRTVPMFYLLVFSNLFLIYLPGLLQFSFWMGHISGGHVTLSVIFYSAILPFIPGDTIKIALTSLILSALSRGNKDK